MTKIKFECVTNLGENKEHLYYNSKNLAGRICRRCFKERKGINKMTTEEAGRKGGLAVKKKYGSKFYRKIGKLGGAVNKRNHSPLHFSEMGEKGGNAVLKKYGKDYYSQMGRRARKNEEKVY